MKNILVIDDNPEHQPNLENVGGKNVVTFAYDYEEALNHVRGGTLPDTVVVDINVDDSSERAFLKELEKQAAAEQKMQPDDNGVLRYARPELIISSNMSGDALYGPAVSLERDAAFPVFAYEKLSKNVVRHLEGSPDLSHLITFKNKVSELFPRIGLEDAVKGIYFAELSEEFVLRGVRAEEVLSLYGSRFEPTKEQQARAILFNGGAGAPVVGRAVFSLEKAIELKVADLDKSVVLIGEQDSPSVMEQAAVIDAAANFSDEPVAHYKEIARGKGLSILSVDFQNAVAMNCVLGDNFLQHSNGVIREGDIVSIDPGNGLLYPEEVKLKSASKPEHFDFFRDLVYERCGSIGSLSFGSQAETAKDVSKANGLFDLSKIENYFIYKKEGKVLLNEYLFDPTEKSLTAVKDFLKTYIREEIVGPSGKHLYKPTFRLMDFKPDELLLDTGRIDELKELLELDDLTGTSIFEMLPELYRVQVEAILEEVPPRIEVGGDEYWHYMGVSPDIVVPMVREIGRYDEIKALVHKTAEEEWGHAAMGVSVLPMIESIEASKPEFVAELVKRVGLGQYSDGGECTSSSMLYIGGSDLMSNIMGGISRSDELAIQKWMEERKTINHPFRSISPEMESVLEQIIDTVLDVSERGVTVRFCGVQAQYLEAVMALQEIGVDQVTVPPEPYYLEGLGLAMLLKKKQATVPDDNTIIYERGYQDRMRRRSSCRHDHE